MSYEIYLRATKTNEKQPKQRNAATTKATTITWITITAITMPQHKDN